MSANFNLWEREIFFIGLMCSTSALYETATVFAAISHRPQSCVQYYDFGETKNVTAMLDNKKRHWSPLHFTCDKQ